MKPLEEIIAARSEALREIRRQQMRIAVIDAAIASDPRYLRLLAGFDGDVDAAFAGLQALEHHEDALLN